MYALQDRLPIGLLKNHDGNWVEANTKTVTTAAANAAASMPSDFRVSITDAPGADAYPITATTFVLMYKQPKSPENTAIAMDFIRWSLESGQPQAEQLHYVPLPSALVQQIEAYWKASFAGLSATASAIRH